MRWVRYLLLGAVVGWLPAPSSATGATGPEFPRPAELREAIAFWKVVFARYPTGQVVVHDSHDLGLIYGVEALPEAPQDRQRAKAAILERYRQALEWCAASPQDPPRTDLERRVRLALSGRAAPPDFRAKVETLRVQTGQRDRMAEGLLEWDRRGEQIRRVLAAHGVPDSLAVLPFIESAYNPKARSHAGASGLWQIMPATGRPFLRIDSRVDDRLDPLKSTGAAARILKRNHQVLGNWPLAITAYNHGTNGVARAVREVGSRQIGDLTRNYRGPRFGFASRNFYAEFVAVLELMQERHVYFGPDSLLAGVGQLPVLTAGLPSPAPAVADTTMAAVSALDALVQAASATAAVDTTVAAASALRAMGQAASLWLHQVLVATGLADRDPVSPEADTTAVADAAAQAGSTTAP